MNLETLINALLLIIGLIVMPYYSAWVMEKKIKKYIPEKTKKRGEKILNDLEILISKAKEFFGVYNK